MAQRPCGGRAVAMGRRAGSQLAALTQAPGCWVTFPRSLQVKIQKHLLLRAPDQQLGIHNHPGAPSLTRPSPGSPLSDFHRLLFPSAPHVQVCPDGFLSHQPRVSQKSCWCCQCYGDTAFYCSHLVLQHLIVRETLEKAPQTTSITCFYNREFCISLQHSFCTTSHCSIKLLLYNSIHSSYRNEGAARLFCSPAGVTLGSPE